MLQEEVNYRKLVREIGIGFHPDTRGEDMWPPLENPSQYEAIIEAAIAAGLDIYEIGLQVFTEQGWTS